MMQTNAASGGGAFVVPLPDDEEEQENQESAGANCGNGEPDPTEADGGVTLEITIDGLLPVPDDAKAEGIKREVAEALLQRNYGWDEIEVTYSYE
jgi:hypothetical protein